MVWFILFLIAIAAILAWQFVLTRQALETTAVDSQYPPEQAAQMVRSAFDGARGVLWTDARGPGNINKRRRGYRRGITMSFSIQPLPEGGSRTEMWASEYLRYMGVLANFAGSVCSRKRATDGSAQLLSQPPSGSASVR